MYIRLQSVSARVLTMWDIFRTPTLTKATDR